MIIGRLDLIINFFTPTLKIPAVIFFRLKGVLFAMLLTEVISVGYCMICLKKPRLHFRIKIRKTLQLIKTGSLIFINKISDRIFWSVDLMILAAMMATSYVGLYSIALSAMEVVVPFSRGINMTVYRKIMVDGGKFGVTSKKHFRKYTEGLFAGHLLFNSLVLGFSILIFTVIIKTILVKYTDSLPIIIILGFGYMIYTSRIFLSFYLNVTNQLNKRLVIILSGLGLNALLDYFLIVKGYGIKGVAFACSLSFLLISVLIMGISFKQIYGTLKSAFSIIFKICSISAILMGIISAFSRWEVIEYTSQLSIYSKVLWGMADLMLKGLIFSGICIGIYFLFFKQYKLYKELKPIISYVWYSFTNRLKMGKKVLYEGEYE
jgi:O-antigen/teichoic acid export membrane protein